LVAKGGNTSSGVGTSSQEIEMLMFDRFQVILPTLYYRHGSHAWSGNDDHLFPLTTLTILWLYHVQRTVSRIGITIGMTALLGVVLRFTGNANIKKIFG
jgi:uncharacterized RDD family membrane protein YckC